MQLSIRKIWCVNDSNLDWPILSVWRLFTGLQFCGMRLRPILSDLDSVTFPVCYWASAFYQGIFLVQAFPRDPFLFIKDQLQSSLYSKNDSQSHIYSQNQISKQQIKTYNKENAKIPLHFLCVILNLERQQMGSESLRKEFIFSCGWKGRNITDYDKGSCSTS